MVAKRKYFPQRGDIVTVHFDKTQGHEQKKLRPALVLTPRSYNKKTGLMIVVPMTSVQKGYPFEVEVVGKKTQGFILSDQVRTLDWQARKVKYVEKTTHNVVEKVTSLLSALISV